MTDTRAQLSYAWRMLLAVAATDFDACRLIDHEIGPNATDWRIIAWILANQLVHNADAASYDEVCNEPDIDVSTDLATQVRERTTDHIAELLARVLDQPPA